MVVQRPRSRTSVRFVAPTISTFELHLQHAFPPLLSVLTMQYCSIVPQQAVAHYGADFGRHPVGSGAFQLKTWQENEALIMVKNPRYFEKNAEGESLPFIDGVKVTFMQNKRNEFLQFQQGHLDLLSGIDATYKDDLLTPDGQLRPEWNGRAQLLRAPYLNTEYIAFQMSDSLQTHPALRKAEVRQAIGYAIDRRKLVLYLRNNIGLPATAGMVPPGLPSFDSLRVRGFTYQPQKARRLLAAAGYPNGQNFPPLTIETNETYKDMALLIQRALSDVGIPVELQLNPPALLREKMRKGQVNFFRGSWIGDYPDAETYLTLAYSPNPAPPNYTRFNNYPYDCLYRQALLETDTSKRYDLYKQMENLLIEEAPLIPLYYDEVLRFVSPRVSDLGINAFNLLTLKQVRVGTELGVKSQDSGIKNR